jgi:hypothetical protein
MFVQSGPEMRQELGPRVHERNVLARKEALDVGRDFDTYRTASHHSNALRRLDLLLHASQLFARLLPLRRRDLGWQSLRGSRRDGKVRILKRIARTEMNVLGADVRDGVLYIAKCTGRGGPRKAVIRNKGLPFVARNDRETGESEQVVEVSSSRS